MDYELLHGRRPTIAELAEIIGESENVTRNLLEALQRARIKSLDHPRNDDEKWTEQLKYDYDLESEVCQEVMNREFEIWSLRCFRMRPTGRSSIMFLSMLTMT